MHPNNTPEQKREWEKRKCNRASTKRAASPHFHPFWMWGKDCDVRCDWLKGVRHGRATGNYIRDTR